MWGMNLCTLFVALVLSLAVMSAGGLRIGPSAYELIVEYETGGRVYYERALTRPTWPKGASGVTIGVGYDLGYNTPQRIAQDWAHLPSAQVKQLQSVAGLKGAAAKLALPRTAGIRIAWSDALRVFNERTVPRFARDTLSAFPGLESAPEEVQGVMLSLVFNRGSSFTGGTRAEMRNCAMHIAAGRWRALPGEFRSMKRLWQGKNLDGLLRRREAEARLIERAL